MSIALSPRRVLVSVAVVGGLAILQLGSAGGLPGLAADVWEYRTRSEELTRYESRTAELDALTTAAAERSEFRSGLHDRMLAGDTPIREAAAEYRAFVGSDPYFDSVLEAVTTGSDDSERVANYVLTSLVKGRKVDTATRHRLGEEFHAAYGRDPDFRHPPEYGAYAHPRP